MVWPGTKYRSFGYVTDAAKTSDMSYRYAWNLIRMAEHHFGKVLIERHAGSQSGGSSTLSAEGMRCWIF
jgi:molybdate transport repressor ModE-like protein